MLLPLLPLQGLQDARFALTGTAVEVPDAERAAVREAYLARHPKAFYVDFGDFRWFRMETVAGGRYIGGFGRISSVRNVNHCFVHCPVVLILVIIIIPAASPLAISCLSLPQQHMPAIMHPCQMPHSRVTPCPRNETQVTPADYHSASPDPVAGFAGHVAGHMNGEASHVRDMVDMVSHYVGLTVDEARMLALDRLGVDMEVSRGGQSFRLRLPFVRWAPYAAVHLGGVCACLPSCPPPLLMTHTRVQRHTE